MEAVKEHAPSWWKNPVASIWSPTPGVDETSCLKATATYPILDATGLVDPDRPMIQLPAQHSFDPACGDVGDPGLGGGATVLRWQAETSTSS